MPNKIEFSDFAELDSRAQRLRSRRAEPGPAAGTETALYCTALHCTALLEDGSNSDGSNSDSSNSDGSDSEFF